jgi:CheY-like chemotaxis protein
MSVLRSNVGQTSRAIDQAEFDAQVNEIPASHSRMGETDLASRESFPPEQTGEIVPTSQPADVKGQVKQPSNIDRQAEGAPTFQQPVGKTVNSDVPKGQPAPVELRPKKKVLVIEDDTTLQMVLEMLLQDHEYDCKIAENGMAAQGMLQTFRPDIIVVDLFMPVMDGLAFLQWLRQTAKDSTPVIVFSTVDDPKIAQDVFKSGANFFVRKPSPLKELLEAMKQLDSLARWASGAALK